jgi:hypothetical protein
MTEAEWLTSTDPRSMLRVVQDSRASVRKVRLFNAAICRRYWKYLPEASRAILLESERLADGPIRAGAEGMDLCRRANAVVVPFDRQYPTKQFPSAEIRIQRNAAAAVCYAVIPGELWGAVSYFWDMSNDEQTAHPAVIRDIFGNPLRTVSVAHPWRAWNDGAVRKMAQAIYDDRASDRLPLLADALEDAGCANAAILDHCRYGGEHVRGCWVVDLLLGKS